MKRIALIYFSGTGNTEQVAYLLKEALQHRGGQVDYFKVENLLTETQSFSVKEYDLIGIGYPVHAFNAPKIIIDFIETLPPQEGKKAFIFKTAGEDSKLNYASSVLLIKKLKQKRYNVYYEKLLTMPSNFLIKYKEKVVIKLYEEMQKDVKKMAKEIIKGKKKLKLPGLLPCILAKIGRVEWIGAALFGKDLKASAECIHCNQCIAKCPTKNIYAKVGKIHFAWKCMMCMRCIYQCPVQAIHPRFLRFLPVRGGYSCPSLLPCSSKEEKEKNLFQ